MGSGLRSVATVRSLAVIALVVAVATACGTSGERAGGDDTPTVVLTLANHEYGGVDVENWARRVEQLSGGTLRIEFADRWRDLEVDYDRGTLADLRAGRVQLAKIAVRSWDDLGVTSFRALGAPFLIDSYALEEQVLRGPLPAEMLAGLEPAGLVGVALLPGPLRRPLGVGRELRRPEDLRGATMGIRPSAMARRTFSALGATTYPYIPGALDEVSRLDGVEVDTLSARDNGFDLAARSFAGNVNLWPRAVTVVMTRKVFDGLTSRQQAALHDAAVGTLPRDLAEILAAERQDMETMCARKLLVYTSSAADLAAWRAAVEPVYAELGADPTATRQIAWIEAEKRRLAARAASAVCPGAQAATTTGSPTPIDGRYRAEVTRDELRANPAYETGEDNPSNYGRFLLVFDGGRFEWTGSEDGIPMGGTFTVDADRVTLHPTYPPGVDALTFVYRWSKYRDGLAFEKVTTGPTLLVVHPWAPAQ
jgi:TRAP-type C4-dicarboxylate transport system substrate-binding protein